MEYVIFALQVLILWSIWTQKQPKNQPETPEEQEARRVAAEAQRLYEQGFVNLMQYDGRPGKDGDRT